MKVTQASYKSDGHVVITGPITGTVTLEDGTEYDVSGPVVEVAEEHRDEVAHLIGQHYAENGHPEVPEGFTYDAPKKPAKKKGR